MAVPRSTPFIASWESDDPLDATAPLEEMLAAHPSPRVSARAPAPPSAPGPSRLAWSVVGVAGVLAAGALVWAAESEFARVPVAERLERRPPPPVRAELQAIPARIDLSLPPVELPDVDEPIATPRPPPEESRPAHTALQPRDELAAALLERRKQLSQNGTANADVEAVAAIHFDPSRRSARVVYRLGNSSGEIVEYWALRDGRWQPLDD